jgi:hypothetical protein
VYVDWIYLTGEGSTGNTALDLGKISWADERSSASQEGFCSMELVTVERNISYLRSKLSELVNFCLALYNRNMKRNSIIYYPFANVNVNTNKDRISFCHCDVTRNLIPFSSWNVMVRIFWSTLHYLFNQPSIFSVSNKIGMRTPWSTQTFQRRSSHDISLVVLALIS